VSDLTFVHVSDLHYGGVADLAQLEALESLVPYLRPGAIIVSGDLTQRARHGEFQAARAFVRKLKASAPTLVIPGNHDAQWWLSPFGIQGRRVKYAKYRRYFGEELTPTLELPGAIIASALTSHGVAFGSLSWNLNDMAVKGHLPRSEVRRVAEIFARAPAGAARIAVVHHNVLRGNVSQRMGLTRWRTAQRRLLEAGTDLVLCGHDHEEGAGQIEGLVAVSTAGTHTSRTRGGRPSVFNLVRINAQRIQIEHFRWAEAEREFVHSDVVAFARRRAAAVGAPSELAAGTR
jgi:3',5'-cyclic AMP phosphodiesterase CpdA